MLELSCVFLSWFLVFRVAICVMFLSCLVKIVVEGGEDCQVWVVFLVARGQGYLLVG